MLDEASENELKIIVGVMKICKVYHKNIMYLLQEIGKFFYFKQKTAYDIGQ